MAGRSLEVRDVKKIATLLRNGNASQTKIADKFGVSNGLISQIATGHAWGEVTGFKRKARKPGKRGAKKAAKKRGSAGKRATVRGRKAEAKRGPGRPAKVEAAAPKKRGRPVGSGNKATFSAAEMKAIEAAMTRMLESAFKDDYEHLVDVVTKRLTDKVLERQKETPVASAPVVPAKRRGRPPKAAVAATPAEATVASGEESEGEDDQTVPDRVIRRKKVESSPLAAILAADEKEASAE